MLTEVVLLKDEYKDKVGVIELYEKASKKLNIKPTNVERSIRTIVELHQDKLKKFFGLKYKIINGALIEAVHREVERRENGDKRKMFMCEM